MSGDFVRILIQERLWGRYLSSTGSWTASPAKAKTFVDIPSATKSAMLLGVQHACILIVFPDGSPDMVLPLLPPVGWEAA